MATQSWKSPSKLRSNGMYRLCQFGDDADVSATTGTAIQKFGSCGSGQAVGPRSPTPGSNVIVAAVQSLAAKSAGVLPPPSLVLRTNTMAQPGSEATRQPVALLTFM